MHLIYFLDGKFRENIDPYIFLIKTGHAVYGRIHTLLIHAQRTVTYGVVIVSRNLERTNENDGFKMAELEQTLVTLENQIF